MDSLMYLVSWVVVVVTIVILNNRVKKEKGDIRFDENNNSADLNFNNFDYMNEIDYRRY